MTKATRELSAAATDDDIYYAYRLLLGREPDAAGWEGHRREIAAGAVKPMELARRFMLSSEYESSGIGALAARATTLEIPMGGFSVFVRSDDRDIGYHIRTLQSYEPHVTAALQSVLRPGMVFIDVGANLGIFTNMAAKLVGAHGLVVAVEPLDKNVQLMYRALAHNGFDNVRVHACAAGDRVGVISILTDPGTSNGQPLPGTVADSRTFFTQTKRLDELTAGVDRMDVVKFDIDGFELIAWRGFSRQLEKFRPIVLTEFHPYGMERFVKVNPLDYLRELFAYGVVEILVQAGDHPRIACAKPADVMSHWHAASEAAGVVMHLDLIVHPRS